VPALTKYGDDVVAYRIAPSRELANRVTCRFVASGSGSYYSRSCDKAAAWAEAWTDAEGKQHIGDYPQLRCNRHRAIDERTRANRGYLSPREYAPFDAKATIAEWQQVEAAAAEHQRLADVHEKVKASAVYILKHAVLATDERQALQNVVNDLTTGMLEVR